jgi:dipeptidyl aminopeptidase/acylaminoacyl peptidase
MKKSILVVIITALVGFLLYELQDDPNPLIPRTELSGDPDYWNVSISPDGKHIAFLSKAAGSKNIFIRDADEKGNEEQLTHETGRGILGMGWTYKKDYLVYVKDNDGDENHQLFSLNIKTKETKALTPGGKVKTIILGGSYLHPNHIIIGLNDRDEHYFDIYKIDIITGKKELVFLNKGGFANFYMTQNLDLKLVSKFNESGGMDYFIHEGGGFLSPYLSVSYEDSETTSPITFDQTGENLYWMSTSSAVEKNRDTAALIKKPFNKSGPVEVLAESDKADIKGAVFSVKEKKPLYTTENYLKPKYIFFDDNAKKDIEFLKSQQDGLPLIIDSNLDENKMIVTYHTSDKITKYYLYNKERKTLTILFSANENLEKYNYSPMYPVEIKSRDGLNLISYLTLPHGVKEKNGIPNKPVPMILFVHGGPMARDSWDFLRSVQRLANRGYAVLQVNYRGSTGFGKNFIKAGHKQHWDKVAEDLQDAVTWAVKQKIADPKKICIMGGSYGGYQALVGITKYPDHYNCAIDIVGMSNLVTDIESDPPYWESVKHLTLKMYGDHTTTEGRNELLRMSPISYVDRIKTPLLIAHGQNDPRVKKSESDQVVKALQDKKIPVTYVLFPDEGHGFANPNNRIAFDAVTEKFLAVHLGGRFEPIGNDLEKSTARILANDINDKAMEKRLEHPAEFIGHE